MKNLVNKMLSLIGYKIEPLVSDKRGKTERYEPAMEEEFRRIDQVCSPFTSTSRARRYALYKAIKYVVKYNIRGDFVECGVDQGGNPMIMAMTLAASGDFSRKIYLYDTFEGMSKPTGEDWKMKNGMSALKKWSELAEKGVVRWRYTSMEKVQEHMKLTAYPEEKTIYVKGKVEDTIPGIIPDEIALLRLDTDWYESTMHEFKYLYPRLTQYGVLILDDYGSWQGAKKATDRYIAENNVRILLNRIDYTGRIGIKT